MDAGDWWNALWGTGAPSALHTTILWEVRMPRTLTAMAAGVLLGWLGMLLQTWFRNPLAGPGVLGITSGGSLGVCLLYTSPSPRDATLSRMPSSA